MASSYDPVRDAKKWASAQSISASNVFVLGLGCGYHSIELAKMHTDRMIIVIENNEDFISWFAENQEAPTNHVICQKPEEFLSYARSYQFVFNKAACRFNNQFFESIQSLLEARDVTSLKAHLQCRLEQKEILENVINDVPQDLISINNITRTLNKEETASRAAHLWRALGELVR